MRMKSRLAKWVKMATVSGLVLGGWTQGYGLMIQDGGFDSTTSISIGVPATGSQAWFIKDADRNQYASWSIVDGYALATSGANASGGNANHIQDLRQYYLDVDPNTLYTLTFDYQAIGAGFNGHTGRQESDGFVGDSEIQLQALEYSGVNMSGSLVAVNGLGNIGTQTAGWTQYSVSFLTGASTESIGLKVGALFGAGSQDSFRLDNVSVPDGGMTLSLLGMGMVGLGLLRRKLS